jgi:hypothetical protein
VARQVQGAILLLTMLMTPIAWAADLDMVLAPPPDPVRGGQAVVMDLYLHNNTDATITHELPNLIPLSDRYRKDSGSRQRRSGGSGNEIPRGDSWPELCPKAV